MLVPLQYIHVSELSALSLLAKLSFGPSLPTAQAGVHTIVSHCDRRLILLGLLLASFQLLLHLLQTGSWCGS